MQWRPPRPNGFRMLAYHSIRPTNTDPLSPYVLDPEQFATHMEWLVTHSYHVIALSAALEAFRTQTVLPPKTLVVSFDDGCRDNLTYAAPIVRRYGITPVVFVCPDLLGKSAGTHNQFWTPSPLLTQQEAQELIQAGWEIGGHTRSHARLVRLHSDEALDDEIGGCRAAIHRLLGYDATTFAYPFGHFTAAVKQCIARHGYKAACSTLNGFNTARTDRFELRRLVIRAEEDLQEFQWKVQGAYDWLGYFKRRSLAKKVLRHEARDAQPV